jgi:hypothetical protein
VKYGRVPFLESQNYGFHLVREAIQRKAVIVIMRAKKRWLSVVPELQDYQPCFDVGNFQNPCISCQNTPDGAWPPIVYAAQGMKPLSRREIDEFADSIPVTITDMVDPVTGLSRFVDGEGDATVVSPPPIDVLFDGPEGDYSYDGDGEWAACCMGKWTATDPDLEKLLDSRADMMRATANGPVSDEDLAADAVETLAGTLASEVGILPQSHGSAM